jgi:hypothetical protein
LSTFSRACAKPGYPNNDRRPPRDRAITVKWMKEHTPNLPAVFDGLRKAGLPEE